MRKIEKNFNNKSIAYIERPKRTRTCHWCSFSITPDETHHAVYRKSIWGFWSIRENVCVFCLEEHIRNLKSNFKIPIKKRKQERNLERLIKEL